MLVNDTRFSLLVAVRSTLEQDNTTAINKIHVFPTEYSA
jgi:hypothetical protein